MGRDVTLKLRASTGRNAALRLQRVSQKPILRPRQDIPWEKDAVFNCAAVYDDGLFHLLYRAVAHNPDDLNRSSIGYAWSRDGVHFERLSEPVLSPGLVPEESQGVEDPRITRVGDTYYMLYTAYNGHDTDVAMVTSKDLRHWQREGVIFSHTLPFGNNKDAAFFPEKIGGRFVSLHRPMPNIYIAYSDDLHDWRDHTLVMEREFPWESVKIGGSVPPIKTDKGWLVIYHGVDDKYFYRLGVALLDLENPAKVIKRQAEPILGPELPWELEGDVPNVVFSCGAVLRGSTLWVYYGGGDLVIGAAKANIDAFLSDV